MSQTFKIEYKPGDKVIAIANLKLPGATEISALKGEELVIINEPKNGIVSILTKLGQFFDVPETLIIHAKDEAFQPYVVQMLNKLNIQIGVK